MIILKRTTLFSIFCFLLFISLLCTADEDLFKTSYVCYDSEQNKRWIATTQITSLIIEGENIYKLTEEGEGFYSGFKDKIAWVAELIFESDKDNIRPLRMERKFFDEDGRQIAEELQDFDFSSNKIIYKYDDLAKGITKHKEFKIKGDIANRLSLGLYIQKFLENGQSQKQTYLFSSEPALYKVNAKVIKEEEVKINGQTKKAYKLYLDPDVGLLNIFKILAPKTYVWHSSLPDYEWLKYSGLECGMNSEKVIIETLD